MSQTLKSITIAGTKFDIPESGEAPPMFSGDTITIIPPSNGTLDLTQYEGKFVYIDVEDLVAESTLTLTLPTNIQFWFTGEPANIDEVILIVGSKYNSMPLMYGSSNSANYRPDQTASDGSYNINETNYLFSYYGLNFFQKIGALTTFLQSLEL
jgi:hypothetical protein